jgi:sulfur-carrier protein adenylyltransferase/sulfurtransferase
MAWKDFLVPVKSMEAEELRAYIKGHKEGSYTLLDVRQPSEYEKVRIPGAKLIPLPELMTRFRELDPQKPLIAY